MKFRRGHSALPFIAQGRVREVIGVETRQTNGLPWKSLSAGKRLFETVGKVTARGN